MEKLVVELDVFEVDDGYRLVYKGPKEIWIERHKHGFSPLGGGKYGKTVGPVDVEVTVIASGFDVKLKGDKQVIQRGFLQRMRGRGM